MLPLSWEDHRTCVVYMGLTLAVVMLLYRLEPGYGRTRSQGFIPSLAAEQCLEEDETICRY